MDGIIDIKERTLGELFLFLAERGRNNVERALLVMCRKI